MPITYTFDGPSGILETVATGDVRFEEIAVYFREVGAERWFPKPSLTDVRQASVLVSGSEIRAIAQSFRQFGSKLSQLPIAVLVGSDVAFGLVRMLALLLDDVAMIRPFRSAEAATAWIEENRL